MRSDTFSQLHQKSMIGAGHPSILGVLFLRCVWHARHLDRKLIESTSEREADRTGAAKVEVERITRQSIRDNGHE